MHRGAFGKLTQVAAALYSKESAAPTNAWIEALKAANPAHGIVEVFPENWQAFQVFARLGTQWNATAGGVMGLNYLVVFEMIDRLELSKDDADNLFADIQHMERVALEEINRKE